MYHTHSTKQSTFINIAIIKSESLLMNILFDTNILIDINSYNQPMNDEVAEMLRNISKLSFRIFVHKCQIEDLQRDKDEERKLFNLSRIYQFELLEAPPIPTDKEIIELKWNNHNDNEHIDNLLLFTLYKDVVHLFVTNDKGIHSKATKSGLSDRVMRLSEFAIYLKRLCGEKFALPAGIKSVNVYQLSNNTDFWHSLQEDYPNFDEWFAKISREHRKAWCVLKDEEPMAVCIYKEEDSPDDVTNENIVLHGKALKLCTFKVSKQMLGQKLGERLLYTAFNYAFINNFRWIYLHTAQNKHNHLKWLCSDFGFELKGYRNVTQNRIDEVYIKEINPPPFAGKELSAVDYLHKYCPCFRDDATVNKFIIPIRPAYHNELFPDINDDRYGLLAEILLPESPQSNTIRKAYICNSNNKTIAPGDILLFYRSHDRKNIQVVGVVEQIVRTRGTTEIDKIMGYVSKRTVYSREELLEKLKDKSVLVILFQVVRYFNEDTKSLNLSKIGIKGPIQTIRQINDEIYTKLLGKS